MNYGKKRRNRESSKKECGEKEREKERKKESHER